MESPGTGDPGGPARDGRTGSRRFPLLSASRDIIPSLPLTGIEEAKTIMTVTPRKRRSTATRKRHRIARQRRVAARRRRVPLGGHRASG
jgi:hypothetical protein